MSIEINDSREHSRHSAMISLGLIIISGLFALGLAEIFFRLLLFSKLSFMSPLQSAKLYADDPTYELFWLEDSFNPTHNKPTDPLLGWVNRKLITPISYRHADDTSIASRRPVLFYGDSFVQCHTPSQDCYQGILNTDRSFSSNYYCLNYGVSGYGLDQTYILYSKTVSRYDNPIVIVGILDSDIERSILPYTFGVKPYFVLENGNLQCHTDHIDIELLNTEFLERHPVNVWSYLGRLLIWGRIIPPSLTTWVRSVEQRKTSIKSLNSSILFRMVEDLRKRDLQCLFILFEWPKAMGGPKDWRILWLADLLKSEGVGHVLARDLIEKTGSPGFDPNRILAGGDGMHFNAEGNRLVSQYILSWIESRSKRTLPISIRRTAR